MPSTIHEAAAEFATDMELSWDKDCGTHGPARGHFEIRVWDGKVIVFRAMSGAARSWHRYAQTARQQRRGYRVMPVFCVPGEDFVAACAAADAARPPKLDLRSP